MSNVRTSLKLSRKIPEHIKELITKYLTSNSSYHNGFVNHLKIPTELIKKSSKISGVSMSADECGFFLHTHRGRSRNRINPLKFTKKEIDWVESTG